MKTSKQLTELADLVRDGDASAIPLARASLLEVAEDFGDLEGLLRGVALVVCWEETWSKRQ